MVAVRCTRQFDRASVPLGRRHGQGPKLRRWYGLEERNQTQETEARKNEDGYNRGQGADGWPH